jgi:putative transposase
MITREIKLRLTVKQKAKIDEVLWRLRSVYNTALTKLELHLIQTGKLMSDFDLIACFTRHGKKCGLNQDAIAECCKKAHRAYARYLFKDASQNRAGKPRRKSHRNQVNSIDYGSASKVKAPKDRHVRIPGIGVVRCSKEELPEGKIKMARVVKRASGYYMQFVLDKNHEQELKPTDQCVGIDPGFKDVLVLSDGNRYQNPDELRKSEARIAQAQRGKNKKLTARLQEKVRNQRQDRNHKISHNIVKNFATIFASDDNFKGMQALFGKSIANAGLANLLEMISYKAQSCGRTFQRVNASFTTQTCSNCWGREGPKGLSGLSVREWDCSSCGAVHDRDINAARVILFLGQGMASGEKIELT